MSKACRNPKSGTITIDVIVDSPTLGIGLDPLLQFENAGHRFLRSAWHKRKRFLIGELLQPFFKRQSLRRRSRLEKSRLLIRNSITVMGKLSCRLPFSLTQGGD